MKDFNSDIASSVCLNTFLAFINYYCSWIIHSCSPTTQIIDMRSNSGKLERSLNNRHHLVSQREIIPTLMRNGNAIRLEGYLFKRTSSTFKTWNRRWFIIQNHQLVYQKRSSDKELTVMEEDLRLCNARPLNDIDRRFCFEVMSPTKYG